ncbi:hypothetical protein AJ78_03994 [Emergomyces pasteurianus Ep9510]|uniref:Uncharacterized protein n=1 Tax=Emergomyces pasteurianus Ep9510 TaxID=1447872 RepID=A0A1J9PH72_9EURO|nr:hypothetical protein AJ78_03994 [Emergomyces pasteurianus Ep9510]
MERLPRLSFENEASNLHCLSLDFCRSLFDTDPTVVNGPRTPYFLPYHGFLIAATMPIRPSSQTHSQHIMVALLESILLRVPDQNISMLNIA